MNREHMVDVLPSSPARPYSGPETSFVPSLRHFVWLAALAALIGSGVAESRRRNAQPAATPAPQEAPAKPDVQEIMNVRTARYDIKMMR
jgi:hypothetical protein